MNFYELEDSLQPRVFILSCNENALVIQTTAEQSKIVLRNNIASDYYTISASNTDFTLQFNSNILTRFSYSNQRAIQISDLNYLNQLEIQPSSNLARFSSNAQIYYTDGTLNLKFPSTAHTLNVTGNIVSSGTIYASNLQITGDTVILNTVTSNTEEMIITNLGSGPALKVTQIGDHPVAEFYDDETLTLLVADGGTVGIRTSLPLQTLDVRGNQYISGNLGIGTAQPNGLLDVKINPTTSVEYPPSALVQNSTSLYNYYSAGTYIASASSFYSTSFSPWIAFNKSVNNSGGWLSDDVSPYLYNATTGIYTGTTTLNGTVYGEWLKIELPALMKITSHTIHPRTTNITTRSPNTFYVLGSTDDTTWVDLTGPTTAANWTSGAISQSWNITNNNYYKYYALVTTVCGNTGTTSSRDYVSVCEWVLNGVPAPYTGLNIQDSKINMINNLGVGIDDVTPVSAIDTGRVRIYNNNTYGLINLARADTGMNLYIEGTGTGSTASLRLRNSGGTYRTAYELYDSHRWYINQDATERMRLDANGNLGIGTAQPLKTLDVRGDINFNGNIFQSNVLYKSSQWTSNIEAKTLYYNDGYIGIGTTNTQNNHIYVFDNKVDTPYISYVLESTQDVYVSTEYKNTNGTLGIGKNIASDDGGSGYIITYDNKDLAFGTNNQYRGRFTADGRFGIGTTGQPTSQQILDVTGGAYISGNVGIGTTNPEATLSIGNGPTDVTSTLMFNSGDNLTNVDKLYWTFLKNGSKIGHSSGWNVNHYAGQEGIAEGVGNGNFRFFTGADPTYNERLTILNNGSVGINSSAPTYNLDVNGNAYISGPLTVNNTITATSFSGTATQVSQNLTRGTYLTGNNYNGSVATTWAVNATSSNTANTVVARDINGNFTAGTITATLSGTATQVSSTLVRGAYLTGNHFNGSSSTTWAVAATTNYNDASVVVARDASAYMYASGVGIGTATARKLLDIQGGDVIVSGNVGIGTTNPRGRLHLYTQNSNIANTLIIENQCEATGNTNYSSAIIFQESSGASVFDNFAIATRFNGATNLNGLYFIGTPDANTPPTFPNNVIMSMRQGGNVGIGTTDPRQYLDVQGNAIVSGNVGIGTTTPLYKLHVVGTTQLNGAITTNNNNINAGTGTITATTFTGTATKVSQNLTRGTYLTGVNYNGSVATTWAVDATTTSTASKVVARDASSYIYVSGVGIGTATVRSPIDVIGNVLVTGNIGIGTTVAKYPIHVHSVEDVFTVNNGKVGISYGSAITPSTDLEIRNSSNTSYTGILLTNDGNVYPTASLRIEGKRYDQSTSIAYAGNMGLYRYNNNASLTANLPLGLIHFGGNHTSGSITNRAFSGYIGAVSEENFTSSSNMRTSIVFALTSNAYDYFNTTLTNTNEKMRLTSYGNLGIGTTNPTHKLHIYSASITDNDYESTSILLDNATQGEAAIAFRNQNVAGNVWVMGLNSNSTRFDIGYGAQSSQLVDASVQFCITSNGTIGIGTADPTTTLDVRGNSYIGKGLNGTSNTFIGGPFHKQFGWDAAAASHTILYPDYCVADNSSGTIHIQVKSVIADKLGNASVSFLKVNAANVDLFNIHYHKTTNLTTFAIATSTSNISITTDSDCAIAWSSIGSC